MPPPLARTPPYSVDARQVPCDPRTRRRARRRVRGSQGTWRASTEYGGVLARGGGMETPGTSDPNRFAQRLFAPLPPRYDRLAELLSMGQNGRWRRAMVDHVAPSHPE